MKTIEEGNTLIAEFLGCYKYPENSFDNVWSYEIYGHLDFVDDGEYEKHSYLPSEMKFHTSWEWLMPVVKKIGSIFGEWDYEDERRNVAEDIFYMDIMFFEFIQMDINAIFERCIEFIKWYNENQQS